MSGTPLRVRVVGDVRVGNGDTTQTLAPMPAAVLCLLVAADGDSLDRDTLIADLWTDDPPASAAGALRVHVAAIRRALETAGLHDRVVTRANGWSLRLDPDELDITRAQWLVQMAGEARRRGDLRAAADAAAEAVALCTGVAMANVPGLPALLPLSGRIAVVADRAEEVFIDTQLDAGNGAAAMDRALRRSTDHPTDERAVTQTVRALHQAGKVVAAIAHCHLHTQALLERGLVPSESFQALELALLRNDLEQVTPRTTPSSAFVGRDAELEWLTALQRQAGDGAFVALVEGSPGMGKTRLTREFLHRGVPLTTRVLWGSCSPERSVPFEPFVEMLSEAHVDTAASNVAERTTDDPRVHELAVVESLVRAVNDALGERGVIVIDDAHWMDAASLTLLRRLVRTAAAPVLVILVARTTAPDDGVGSFVVDLERVGMAQRRHVRGLDDVAVKQLAAADGYTFDGSMTLTDLTALSGGNPLFVRALLRALDRDGVRALGDATRIMHDLVRARLATVPAEHAATLAAAAVLGPYFRLGVVAELRGIELEEALDGIEVGQALEMVGATDRFDEFGFEHAVFRDAVLSTLTPARRALVHRRAADVLAEREGDTPSVVRHLVEAGELVPTDRLVRSAMGAAVAAVSAGTYAIAGEMAAIAAPHVPPGGADDAQLRAVLGAAAMGAGDVTSAAALWQQALDSSLALGLDSLTARVLTWQSTAGRVTDDAATLQLFRDLCVRLRADGNVRSLATALDTMSTYLRLGPHRAEARAVAAELTALADAQRDPLLQASASRAWHHALFVEAAPVDERRSVTARGRTFADQSGDPFSLTLAHLHAVNDALTAGDPDSARDAHVLMAAQVREVPFPLGTFLVEAVELAFRLLADDLDGLDDELTRVASLGRELQVAAADFTFAGQLFLLRWAQGRLAETAGPLEFVAAANPGAPIWQYARALALHAAGDPTGATEALRRALPATVSEPRRDWLWLPEGLLAAEACALLGDEAECNALVRVLEPFGELDAVVAEGSVISMGPVARPLAVLFARVGDRDAADRWSAFAATRTAQPSAALWHRLGIRHDS